MYKNFNQGKTSELSFFNERKRAGIRSTKSCYRNIMNRILYRISKCFLKRVFLWYGMLCYAILSYAMVWYGTESMVYYEISMLCYEISMLCYAMVYVVKDKHSATVT